jgi:oligopeptide transport system substrate-binding protein
VIQRLIGIFLAFFLLLFISCTGVSVNEQSAQEKSEPVDELASEDSEKNSLEEEQKEKEFVYALLSTEVDFDPLHAYTALESQVYTAIYEGLVTYNPFTLNPLPGAASHWDKSPDGKTYRFYIREDALYSNGDQVKAQDFRDSWLRILDPKAGAEYSTFFDIIKGARAYRMGEEDDPESIGIRVVSDSILDIELETPAAHFLKLLCHMSFVPVHPHYAKEEGWDKRSSIVGNGPFYVLEKNEQEIVFVKNNLYWDKKRIKIDKLIMRFYNTPGEISIGFNRGLVDWATNWDSSVLQDTSKIIFNPLFATNFFFFKCVNPPWDDYRVRRALALLVPWERIRTDQIFYTTDTLVPKVPKYPEVEGISKTNQKEAFELLEQAGYPRGKELPPIKIRISSGGDSEEMAKIMADAWKESLGVDVIIDAVDFRSYFDSVKKKDFTLGRMTWIGDFADPLTFLQMWTSDSNLNDADFIDSEYDRLVQDAIPIEGKTRYEKLSEAEALILRKAVVLPISNQPTLNLIDLEYIEGWYPNALDLHPFKYLNFKEARLLPNLVMR